MSIDALAPADRWAAAWDLVRSDESRRAHDRAERRRQGAFYTPIELARLTVRKALDPLCLGKPVGEIARLRLLDPAVGSGVFMLAALEYLLDRGLPPRLASSCLAGHDTDSEAIAVARRALSLCSDEQPELRVCDSLELPSEPQYAAIIGNPPWEKIARGDPRQPCFAERFSAIRQGE
ncbi:MAG: N-6 DNA methylase, partial [Cyanobacteria bacterium REEB65]|nr:N-6 DNA methylase [Cyanobacteria bacterium REEB65]